MERLRFYDMTWDQVGLHSISLYNTIEYGTEEDLQTQRDTLIDQFNETEFDDGVGLPYIHWLFDEDELKSIREKIETALKNGG